MKNKFNSIIIILVLQFAFNSQIFSQGCSLLGNNDSTFNNTINSITTDNLGNVYAAGIFTNQKGYFYVAKWNGSTWGELGGTNTSTFVDHIQPGYGINSIATDNNGNLYAGGFITNNNGKDYIAKWNGSNWSELGDGIDSNFNGVINCITTDKNGNVYAGGYFTNAKGKNYVAKWNGTTWSQLGGSDDSTLSVIHNIITDSSGNVYSDGYIGTNNQKLFIAKWDGSSWSGVGGAFNIFNDTYVNISSITIDPSGNLYAAGGFMNKSHYYYMVKWDGNNWSQLGGESDSTFGYDPIQKITSDKNGNIYAGGGFEKDSIFPPLNINLYYTFSVAKWNGSSWGIIGSKQLSLINQGTNTLATDANNNLYFGESGANSINGENYIVKYAPSNLPVKLASINAIQENKTIAINWHTATELNTSHFIIQHSTDGTSFTGIGTVKAIGSGANSYSFTDTHPTNGTNYYRLEIIDNDGSISFSKVVSASLTINDSRLTIYPNPAKSIVTISGNHIASVQVIDNIGRVVKIVSLKDATNPTLSVSGLQAGAYHLRVQTTDGNVSGVGLVKE